MAVKHDNGQFFAIINQSLKDIGAQDLSPEQFKIVINAMSSTYRIYHNSHHLQEMTLIPEEHVKELHELPIKDFPRFLGIIRIAGFFHDLIYTQVDTSLDGKIERILRRYLDLEGGKWFLKKEHPDIIAAVAAAIFAFKPDEAIPPSDLNEFLSAVIAGKILEMLKVNLDAIAKVIACIEATIPFRTQDEFDKRSAALRTVIPNSDIGEAMYASVYLANKDSYNFSGYEQPDLEERIVRFVHNSWRLAIEADPDLKNEPVYSAKFLKLERQHIAFIKGFLSKDKKYRNLYHSYEDYPTPQKLEYMQECAREVLQCAITLHSIKFVGAGIFGALDALCHDEDAYPLSLQTELSNVYMRKHQETFFNKHQRQDRSSRLEQAILGSLDRGRNLPSSGFDSGKTPLGKFLYQAIPQEKIIELSKFLEANSFYTEKDAHTRRNKADEYRRQIKKVAGKSVYDTINAVLKDVFTQLNDEERMNYINKKT